MRQLWCILAVLFFIASVYAEQVAFLRLPSYLKLEKHGAAALSGKNFESLIKGMVGMPASEDSSEVEVVMAPVLKSPKIFVFLRLISQGVSLPESFSVLPVEGSESANLYNLIADVKQFYGKNAYVMEMGDHSDGETLISVGLSEALEMIKSVQSAGQYGPLFVFSPNMSLTVGADELMKQFSENVAALFGNDAVIVALNNQLSASSRVKRQAPNRQVAASANVPTESQLNLGESYSDIYPAIFNIILWFMIAMGITIASVAYCIWFMDPGKDGIIYRMTASRIKKDL